MTAETKAPGIIATVVICSIISTVFVFARLYSRFLLKLFRLDDWLLIVAWIFNIALSCLTFADVHFGTGKHTAEILPSELPSHYKIQYATGILYYLVLPITKLSICILYQHIVEADKTSRVLIKSLKAYLIVTGLGLTCYITCECIPVSAYWNDQFGEECHRRRTTSNTIFFVNAASNTFSDICIILIVLPVIWKLKMGKRPKLAIYGIVCLGWFCVISSALRMIIVSKVLKSSDPAWEAADMDIWSCVECSTSLICAAAPSIRPVLNKFRPRLFPSYVRHTMGHTEIKETKDIQITWEMADMDKSEKKYPSTSTTALNRSDSIFHKEISSDKKSIAV